MKDIKNRFDSFPLDPERRAWIGVSSQGDALPLDLLPSSPTPEAPAVEEHQEHAEEKSAPHGAPEAKAEEPRPRRCRVHARWRQPPPVRSCLLCKLAARER